MFHAQLVGGPTQLPDRRSRLSAIERGAENLAMIADTE